MLLVGLGNPGKEYSNTRHNIGFMAIDRLVDRHNFSEEKQKFKGLFSEGMIAGKKIYALKPQTFMNNSGISVSEIVRFYKIPLADVCVIYDELDLALCKVKMKQGGGSGGHNGIKSIDHHVGADYVRMRLGIDHPGGKKSVSSYVLQKFKQDEQEKVDWLLDDLVAQIPVFVKDGRVDFLTKLALVRGEKVDAKKKKDNSGGDKTPSKNES